MNNAEKPEVVHNEAQREFYIKQKEGSASLYYEYVDKETVDLQHTVVADNLRGRGLGDLLAEAALSFATKNKLKVKLSCSFLVHYALKNSLNKTMEEVIELANYYGRCGYSHTMRNVAKGGLEKYHNSSVLQYYAALPLFLLKEFKDFVRESRPLKSDQDVALAINIALIYCNRANPELLSDDEVKAIDSQITTLRKKASEKALFHAANFLMLCGRLAKAKEYIDRLLKLYPNSYSGLSLRGWIEVDSDNVNRNELAHDFFKESLNSHSDSLSAALGHITCLKLKGDLYGALEFVNHLVLKRPGSLPPLIEKAKVYISACKWEEAEEVAGIILRENSTCLAALQINSLCLLCGDGDFNKAAVNLQKLYVETEKIESLNASYFFDNACLFSKLSSGSSMVLDETMRFIEKSVQLQPDNATYLTELGNQFYLKGKTKEAVKIFRNAMKVDEVSLNALIGLTKAQMADETSGVEQAFKNIKLLGEVEGAETLPEVMLMTAIMNRCGGNYENSKCLLSKAINKHLSSIESICSKAKYGHIIDPEFLLRAACECLILTPVPHSSSNLLEESHAIYQELLKPAISGLQCVVRSCPGMRKGHMILAKANYFAGKFDLVIDKVKHLIENVDSTFSEAYLVLAHIYSEFGDMEQASASLESGLSFDFTLGQHLSYHLVNARILRENGDLAASISVLEKCIKSFSNESHNVCSYSMLSMKDEVSILLELAESYYMSGSENESEKFLKEASLKFKGTPEIGRITLAIAQMALKQNDYNRFMNLLNTITVSDPYHSIAQQKLAEFYHRERNFEMYTVCYKNIVDCFKETCPSLLLYGSAMMHIQETNKAITVYEKVLSREPNNSLALCKMGEALIKSHLFGKAMGYLKEGAGNEERPQMKLTLASLLFKMKQFEKAERVLLKELEETKGEDVERLYHRLKVLLLLAKVFSQLEKNESSISVLCDALDLQFHLTKMDRRLREKEVQERDISNTCITIASIYEKTGKHAEAVKIVKRGLERSPNDISLLETILNLQNQLGDSEQCHAISTTILKVDPHNKSAFMVTADLAFSRLDFDSAAFHLEQLLEKHDGFWEGYAKLIETRRRAGRLDELPNSVRGDSISESGTPAGLAYCRGLYSWYVGKPAAALHHFQFAKRDVLWAWNSICCMVEIYLYPDGDSLPGSSSHGNMKGADEATINTSKGLLSELQKLCQNKDQRLCWRLLDVTALLATREKQNIELALKELSAIAVLPESRVDHVGVALALATGHILLKQGSRARNHLKRVARNQWNPDDASYLEKIWLLLADHYFHSGKNESAAELLQRALQYNKSCVKAQELLGQVMEKAQSFNEAVVSYENAWKMGLKDNVAVGYKLAHAHMKAKHYAEAIDVCHELIRSYPNETRIRKDILEKCRLSLRT